MEVAANGQNVSESEIDEGFACNKCGQLLALQVTHPRTQCCDMIYSLRPVAYVFEYERTRGGKAAYQYGQARAKQGLAPIPGVQVAPNMTVPTTPEGAIASAGGQMLMTPAPPPAPMETEPENPWQGPPKQHKDAEILASDYAAGEAPVSAEFDADIKPPPPPPPPQNFGDEFAMTPTDEPDNPW